MVEDSSVLFSVGIIADVQYGIRKNSGLSHFKDSLRYLEEAILCFNNRRVDAVINLGDLVDSNEPNHLNAALEILNESKSHVINIKKGNCLEEAWNKKDMGGEIQKGQLAFYSSGFN